MLAVGTIDSVIVFSSTASGAHTDLATPRDGAGKVAGEIKEIAAGRLDDDRFFVAAATVGSARNRIYLFVQDGPGSKSMVPSGCIERKNEPGFGGVMIAGDLDGDGRDELMVSATLDKHRVDAVYVYDISEAIENGSAVAPNCIGDGPELLATVLPQKGDLDVECPGEGCRFGAALTLGDIATDDKGPELCVGAPGAKVEGQEEAGAVYIYRGAALSKGQVTLAGQVTDSWQDGENWFGGGLAVAPVAGRNELLIGATGDKGEVFIAFCTGVGVEPEDLKKGADVPYNANGSIISTRCRP